MMSEAENDFVQTLSPAARAYAIEEVGEEQAAANPDAVQSIGETFDAGIRHAMSHDYHPQTEELVGQLLQLVGQQELATEGPWAYTSDTRGIDGCTIFVDEFGDGEQPNPSTVIASGLQQGFSEDPDEEQSAGVNDSAFVCSTRNADLPELLSVVQQALTFRQKVHIALLASRDRAKAGNNTTGIDEVHAVLDELGLAH